MGAISVHYPDEVQMRLRLPGALRRRLARLAEYDDRRLNEEIVAALLEWARHAEVRQKVAAELKAWAFARVDSPMDMGGGHVSRGDDSPPVAERGLANDKSPRDTVVSQGASASSG